MHFASRSHYAKSPGTTSIHAHNAFCRKNTHSNSDILCRAVITLRAPGATSIHAQNVGASLLTQATNKSPFTPRHRAAVALLHLTDVLVSVLFFDNRIQSVAPLHFSDNLVACTLVHGI